jgi:hypothetical protein
MITLQDTVKLGEKYGLAITEYQGKYYLQPVNIVGDRVYLQSAAPVWKKNGQDMVGKPRIVSFGIGDKTDAVNVLKSLATLVRSNNTTEDEPPF